MAVTNYIDRNHEDVLFYAFRYALGRRTGAVLTVVSLLIENWSKLRPHTRLQIQNEIETKKLQRGNLGDDCDLEQWQKILDLPAYDE